MNIHAVSKGVVLYMVLLFAGMSVLIFNGFSLAERTFTVSLILGIFLIGLYVGKSAGDNSTLNGFLIGLITSVILIFFISLYTDMNWELNFMIMVVWTSISTVGGFIGGKYLEIKSGIVKRVTKVREQQESHAA